MPPGPCILRPLRRVRQAIHTRRQGEAWVDDPIDGFLHYMSAERGASKNTIDAYRNDLRGFREFTEQRSGNGACPVDKIDSDLIVDYIVWLNDSAKQYKKATVARKVASVKSFCAYLLDHGELTTNPTASITSPRAPKLVPKAITTEEIDTLLREPTKGDTPERIRDAAMLELTYATGMRATELVSLNLDSVHLRPAYVRCVGKGAKERSLPVHPQAVQALERYLNDGRPALLKNRPQAALFVNRRGERLTRQGFWLILTGYARSAGIESRVTPHTLRHSFATHLLRGGASLREVQELLGHANVSTTQVYTQLADDHLRQVYDRVHPRAQVPGASPPSAATSD